MTQDQFQIHLPADYEAMAQLEECFPGNKVSHFMPFVFLVVNINVQTEVHQDKWDKNLCLALAIGDFSNGGLVLKKQGLIWSFKMEILLFSYQASQLIVT